MHNKNIVTKRVVNPYTQRKLDEVAIRTEGGGLEFFRWNYIWGVYNSAENYRHLTEEDLKNVVFFDEIKKSRKK